MTVMKVVINLSLAEQKKKGLLFELAVARGVLKNGKFLKNIIQGDAGFIGAWSLGGTVLPVEGMRSDWPGVTLERVYLIQFMD
ncbi:hypothetical protein UN64_05070 [Fictibacillus arsenicus]|uniref:Uncharacterized protein n=1 Tax=Fictibacillus arsenicus TaxID=255247 RepID=A0A1V3GCK3_9BACL|nr:hypothetical protein UN64_05070 [Fictibacillus arsenicus]